MHASFVLLVMPMQRMLKLLVKCMFAFESAAWLQYAYTKSNQSMSRMSSLVHTTLATTALESTDVL